MGKLSPEEIRRRTTPPAVNTKERHFIEKYTNPDSPTYGNGTQTARDVYGYYNKGTAAVKASRLLRQDNIQLASEAILQQYDAGENVRLGKLADIITGRYEARQTVEHEKRIIRKEGKKGYHNCLKHFII